MDRWVKVLLLTCMIVAGVALVYKPHLAYPFPLLWDEYVHISFAKQFLSEGTLSENPYLAPSFPHLNLESGFHVFLSGIVLLLNDATILQYQYFPALFFVINALLLFYLLRLWTGEFLPALLGVFFFGTIESSGPILTHHYFLPLTLGVTLLLLSCICFHLWTERERHIYLLFLLLVLLLAAFTYPPALFFFLGAVLVYILSLHHQLPGRLYMRPGSFFGYSLTASVLLGLLGYALLHYFDLLDEVVFYTSWAMQQNRISLVWYFGLVPSLFAAIGLYLLLRGRELYHTFLLYWFLYAAATIYLFYVFNLTVLVPFPRLYFFYLISVSMLAGIGSAWVLRSLWDCARSRAMKYVGVAAILLSLLFHYFFVAEADVSPQHIVNEKEHAALLFLRERLSGAGVVIADPYTSFSVYPITGMHVVNLLDANVGGGDPRAARRFLEGSCLQKKDSLAQLKDYMVVDEAERPVFVLTPHLENCGFLTLLYEDEYYIYSISQDALHTPSASPLHASAEIEEFLTPPETYATPLRPILTEKELRAYLINNTIEGDGWTEYLAPDGTIFGVIPSGDTYQSVWKITGSVYCYYHPDSGDHGCQTVSRDGDLARFYNMKGVMRDTATVLPGNPYGL